MRHEREAGLVAHEVAAHLEVLLPGELLSVLVCSEAGKSGRERDARWLSLDPDPARDTVLKSFIRDGRLTHFPTFPDKFRIVLEYLVNSFEPGRSYPESEVNEILNRWHPDHAALRRQLVDARLLERSNSIYVQPQS